METERRLEAARGCRGVGRYHLTRTESLSGGMNTFWKCTAVVVLQHCSRA